MNPDGIRFFIDSEFRDKYVSDIDFWFIVIGMSYAMVIIFNRDWVLKSNIYRTMLLLAIGLSAIGNVFGFLIYKTGTALGALNGPIISIIVYRLLYEWFKKKYDKPPASPFDTFWSNDITLMKDGLLNFVFLLISFFSTAIFGVWTNGKM